MILAPVESVENGDVTLDVLFYNTPVKRGARPNGSEVRRFTILFAPKEEEGKVLLSTSNDFTQLGLVWRGQHFRMDSQVIIDRGIAASDMRRTIEMHLENTTTIRFL